MGGGQGMPWGPTTYGQPSAPKLETDPTKFSNPGLAAQQNNVRTMAGQAQGRANNGALAALQKSGVGGGSEASNALGNIAGQTAAGEGEALSGLQAQDNAQQMGLMEALNNAELQKYGMGSQNYNQEQGQRQNAIGGLGGGLLEALTFLGMKK